MNASEPSESPMNSFPSKKSLAMIGSIVVLAALLGVGLLVTSQSGKAAAKPLPIAPALTVTSIEPSQVSWAETITASGAVAPWQEAIIGSQIGGYQLDQVRVNVGDVVRKGQVLAHINADLLRAEEAQLAPAYEQAQVNAKRAISLQGSGGISDQDVLQASTLAKTALGQLVYKQLQLRYTDVIAPEDGIISSRTATIGSVVASGQELFRMIVKGRLEWRGEVTAEQLQHLAPGQQVSLALPGGMTATAVVRQLAPTLDSGSRLGLVYADIASAQPVRAGMYANGTIALSAVPALVVPTQSVVIRDGHTYVLKLSSDGRNKVQRLAVLTGRRQGSEIEIVSGINADDELVVQGAGFLNDGDVVRVVKAAAAVPVQEPK